MNGFAVGFQREWRALTTTPLIWGAAAAVALPAGMGFAFGGLAAGSPADLSRAIGISVWCVGAAACALGARSIPGDRRAGTWDLALASPIDAATLVLARFAAIAAACAALLLPIALQAALLGVVAAPSWSAIACGMLGLWLLSVAAAGAGLLVGAAVRSAAGAIVASLAAVAAWIALCRGGQSLGWPPLAAAAFALDPLRRAEDFTRGALDLGSGASLLAMGFGAAWCAATWAAMDARVRRRRGELERAVALLGAWTAVVAAVLAVRGPGGPPLRIEAASLFSGSLQPATREWIAARTGPLSVTLMSARAAAADELALRHARAVLARAQGSILADGSPLRCRELDGIDPADAQRAAELFEEIEAAEAKGVSAWRDATAAGLDALRSIEGFAGAAGAQLQALAAARPRGDAVRTRFESVAAAMDKTASEGAQVRSSIAQLAASTPERPLGDPEAAGRRLANELKWWASTLQEVADAAGDRAMTGSASLDGAIRQLRKSCASLAEQARAAQDRIDQLPPLRLSEVAAAMQSLPALIVSGGGSAAAVPAWQMRSGVDAAEQALAEALRGAAGAPRVAVTVVHAQPASPLEPVGGGGDLSLFAQSLRAARMDVDAWNPVKGPRPVAMGATHVWVVIPPLDRSSPQPDPADRALLEASRRLVADGERVLVAATPNPFASMGMNDPWADLLQSAGLRARSGQVVLDLGARSETATELRGAIELTGAATGHAAGRAAVDESILWPMPIPIEIRPRDAWSAMPVASIPPAAQRWIENDPRVVSRAVEAAPDDKRLREPVPVLVVAQRDDGARVALAGGMSWLLTAHAGLQEGERRPLRHPGNRDLALGVIRWLAGGEPIATLADTGRIPQLAEPARIALGAAGLVGIPLGLALTGRAIWRARRSR